MLCVSETKNRERAELNSRVAVDKATSRIGIADWFLTCHRWKEGERERRWDNWRWKAVAIFQGFSRGHRSC